MAFLPQWFSEIVTGLVIKPKHLTDNFSGVEAEFNNYKPAQLGGFFNGFSLTIANNTDTFAYFVPYNCSIVSYSLLADQTSSAIIAVEKSSYAAYNGGATVWTSITGASPPTLSSQNKNQDAALVGWSRNLLAGDLIRFKVTSNSNNTKILINLVVNRTT
jgi:hypothetical protein